MAKKTGKKLVIVESPAKAKTINKYLGTDYVVKASMGHVRDLPSKGMGVDLESFEPTYEVLKSRDKVMKELRTLAKSADEIWLATDLDREGEAIAWHLKEALNIPNEATKRVIFNAITKSEIQKAFQKPMPIDQDRVNAQQARRILDRIVGYEISPILWRKVARGLSAGRVQSVAVRLIVEREKEIQAFIPEEFWKISALFTAKGEKEAQDLSKQWTDFLNNTGNGERTKNEQDHWLADREVFLAELIEVDGKKFSANSKLLALNIAKAMGYLLGNDVVEEDPKAKGPAKNVITLCGTLSPSHAQFAVSGIEKKRTQTRPPGPFITSTLQQAASSRLGFGAQRTMRLAQNLYESGFITYMRTDSTHLSGDALGMTRDFIEKSFGAKYLPEKPNFFASSNKSAQEAHEAIRPTDVMLTPEQAAGKLGVDELKLYTLIWKRLVSCQMPPAEFDQTTALIKTTSKLDTDDPQSPVHSATFKASGRKLVFDGFMRVAGVSSEDQLLPELRETQSVYPLEIDPTQHFTQPPARYTEASLVKEMERLGIGRPSTYASIIQTIQSRKYVELLDRRFFATQLGTVVTDKLIQGFPKIMDVSFTADMEGQLDKIEEQHLDWIKLLKDFYGPFHESVEGAMGILDHAGGAPSDYKCEKCGLPMVYRISATGFFLACSNRECSSTRPVDSQGNPMMRETTNFKCPLCGREMIKRRGRFGEFLGCAGYSEKNDAGEPLCSCIINLDKQGNPLPPKPKPVPTNIVCEKCGGPMVLRNGKRGPWLGCAKYPKCRNIRYPSKLTPEEKAHVDQLIPHLKEGSEQSAELIQKILGQSPLPSNGKPVVKNMTTDIDCEECGKPMIIRDGKRGKFLGCSGYPKCRNTGEVPAKLLEELGMAAMAAQNDENTPAEPPAEE